MFTPFRAVATMAAVLIVVSHGFAQSDLAQISGFVRDPSAAVVPNATVTITNEATNAERKTQTNESGYYVVPNLPPGYYTVTVEAAGFKKFVRTRNKLDPNLPLTVDVTLDVGAVTETVEVVASVAAVQSETATVGRLVESTQIQNMMLNGRNPIWLALLKAGVRSGSSLATFNFTLTTAGLSINGGRTQDFLMTFDGAVAVRTRANGTSIGVADVDTVQEIQILTANYNAEYGRSNSGQVRIVTKSGTRDFHGSFYEYFRNYTLDANSWARNRAGAPRPKNKFNQFGYNINGPVFLPGKWNTDRDKLFFLWSQEWVRFRQDVTSIITVPSLRMRQGDFSELLNPANTFFGRVRTVNDPDTGAPFPGNIIPANRLSPNGLGFLRAYPEPTPGFLQGTANFIQTRPQPTNQRKDTLALDFNPSSNHAFRFRHQNYSFTQIDAFRGGTDRAVTDWNRPNKTASLNYIWTISPTFINEALITASVDRVYIGVHREGQRFARSKYGINYPYIFPERKEIFDKIPTVDISGFAVLDGGPYPAFSSGPIYVYSNNMTKIAGNHTFKWGVSYERSGQNDFDQINVTGVPGGTNNQNGRFVFTDTRAGATTTGVAVANAAMGLFTTYAEIGQRAFTPYRANMFEWFFQDSWKVTPKFRLELGVRWTYMTPYFYSLWGNIAVFDPKRYNPANAAVQDRSTGFIISGDRFNGITIPGKGWPEAARGRVALADDRSFDRLFNGGPRYWGERQWTNFQPRVGIAYAISPKNALRAGFGRFMARPGVSDNIFLGGNPPLQPMVSIANGQADNPSGGRPSNFPLFFMTTDPVFKIPSAYIWNVTYEREIGFDTTVSAAYVGRVGLHLERERNMNPLQLGTLLQPENRGVEPSVLRPYKGFQVIALGENAARSEYNGLQLEVNRRFSKGLSYGFSYTYSKSMDNASDRRARIWNPWDDRNFWGPSAFDTRHIAVINFIYQLPLLRGRSDLAGRLLGGWQVTGIVQFQTGAPFTVGTGDDFAGIGAVGEGQPWEMLGNPKLPRGERRFSQGAGDANFWFRTRLPDGSPLFTTPTPGTFSRTQTRNLLNHPGFQNWNVAVFKDFGVREGHTVQFRAEFFNFPNHPNWGGATADPRSATFGKVTSKGAERNVQLVLRYNF
ncbi:MAG: carboxypeptidase-like regulatory domain-containing protein [Bryobacterales bacterium]|nr:carboxypeptidase-like regulatory domain-containing protein [Bryobacteraceae bacterium]MDW8354007.1 carboxypeptidase-like regulatory domain-containing protein [Bryobacterales bacterium]